MYKYREKKNNTFHQIFRYSACSRLLLKMLSVKTIFFSYIELTNSCSAYLQEFKQDVFILSFAQNNANGAPSDTYGPTDFQNAVSRGQVLQNCP